MTISWDTKITVKDEDAIECSIQSIRTDDATNPDTVNTVNIASALLTSQEEGNKVIDAIYDIYLEQVDKETKISDILTTYQNYFNNQLEGKEI